jgi:hypothetical protein
LAVCGGQAGDHIQTVQDFVAGRLDVVHC